MVNGELVRVTMKYALHSAQVANNVFTYQYQGPTVDDGQVMDDITDWSINTWGHNWDDITAAAHSIIGVSARVIDANEITLRNIGDSTFNVGGTQAVDALPNQNAAIIHATTAVPKTKGTKYVPSIPDSGVVDDVLQTIWQLTLLVLLSEWLGGIPVDGGVGELIAGVISRTLVQFVPFNGGGSVNANMGTQRRRTAKRGS